MVDAVGVAVIEASMNVASGKETMPAVTNCEVSNAKLTGAVIVIVLPAAHSPMTPSWMIGLGATRLKLPLAPVLASTATAPCSTTEPAMAVGANATNAKIASAQALARVIRVKDSNADTDLF
jgi:hypothetical protein